MELNAYIHSWSGRVPSNRMTSKLPESARSAECYAVGSMFPAIIVGQENSSIYFWSTCFCSFSSIPEIMDDVVEATDKRLSAGMLQIVVGAFETAVCVETSALSLVDGDGIT